MMYDKGMGPTEYTPDIRLAPDHELVCYCKEVTKGMILEAMRKGAKTLEDIKTMTSACTVGRCKETNPRKR